MAIRYSVTRKLDKSGAEPVSRYSAQNKVTGHVSNIELAKELSQNTSLNISDVLAVLEQLPDVVCKNMKEGKSVKINRLGTFFNSLTSSLEDSEQAVTPDKVHYVRVVFKALPPIREALAKSNFLKSE